MQFYTFQDVKILVLKLLTENKNHNFKPCKEPHPLIFQAAVTSFPVL